MICGDTYNIDRYYHLCKKEKSCFPFRNSFSTFSKDNLGESVASIYFLIEPPSGN